MTARLLTQKQVDACTSWLLANGSPPVRYLTLRHLQAADPTAASMKAAWRAVLGCPDVKEIFGKQREDGSWYDGGTWSPCPRYMPKDGYSAFTPKYVTTVWILGLLGDMGFTLAQAPVKRAVRYILSFLQPNGLFSRFAGGFSVHDSLTERDNWPCDQGIYLSMLGKVGMGNDPRLDASYELLVRWQRTDGGWITEKHRVERQWNRSCPQSTGNVISALYFSQRKSLRELVLKGLAFQVWHLEQKSEDEICQFRYHGHNTIHELMMLAEFGVHLEAKPVRTLLAWLAGMYQSGEHCFRCADVGFQQTKGGRPIKGSEYWHYHLVEPDWLTYYATRISAYLLRR